MDSEQAFWLLFKFYAVLICAATVLLIERWLGRF